MSKDNNDIEPNFEGDDDYAAIPGDLGDEGSVDSQQVMDPFDPGSLDEGDLGEGGVDSGDLSGDGSDVSQVEVTDEGSRVASAPARNIVIIAVLAVASLVFLYYTVFDTGDAPVEEEVAEEEQAPVDLAVPPTQQEEKPRIDIGVIETPEVPDIGGLQPPPVSFDDEIPSVDPLPGTPPVITPSVTPAVAPPVISAPILPQEETEIISEPLLPSQDLPGQQLIDPGVAEAERLAKLNQKRKSSMLVMNGGGGSSLGKGDKGKKYGELSITTADRVEATAIGNTDNIIAQGKLVHAILETAINTDLPGMLRALVSRDVYAESGKKVLIPKGSRLIGTYDDSVDTGQSRLLITWTRMIRPDGVDIQLDSPGTDQLGRAGSTGIVDNKYFEVFSNAFLVSILTIGGAAFVEESRDSSPITSSSSVGTDGGVSSSTSGSAVDLAVTESATSISDTAKDLADDLINSEPTIYINQGTRLKVFVNRDLIFPESVSNTVTFIN